MKKSVLILSVLLFATIGNTLFAKIGLKENGFDIIALEEDTSSVKAQTNKINTIKKEIDKLMKKKSEVKCESKKKDIHNKAMEPDGIAETDSYTYKKCSVGKNYLVVEGSISKWEYYEFSKYYYLDNKLVFAYMNFSTVLPGPEYKIYFNDKEEIIRVLETSENFDTGVKTLDVELKDKIEINKVKGYLENNLNTLKEYFGQ